MPPTHAPPPVSPTDTSAPETRRAVLRVQANPAERVDYRVILSRPVSGCDGAGALHMTLEYVPDRVILVPDSLTRYVAGLEHLSWPGPEALGVAILDDINNEVVPRWLRVTVVVGQEAQPHAPGSDAAPWHTVSHAVILEDRQPHWTAPAPAPPGPLAAR